MAYLCFCASEGGNCMWVRFQQYLRSPWLLGLIGGVLMCLAWEFDLWPFLFIAWLPWLLLMQNLVAGAAGFWKSYGLLYFAVWVWNACSVWWIQGATVGGMLGAVFAMAACMALVLTFVVQGWRRLGSGWGYTCLLAAWIGFEYFFHNSEIAWPWLTLGNGLAPAHWAVQWYEYTGVLGGSLWILAFNILLFITLQRWQHWTRKLRMIVSIATTAMLLLLFVISWLLYPSVTESNASLEVVIVQPNVDPWHEKFNGLTDEEQVARMLSLAREKMTPATRLVIMPETSIPSNIWTHKVEEAPAVLQIREFLQAYPQARVVVGTTLLRYYQSETNPTQTARKLANDGEWYDAYNAALCLGVEVGESAQYFKSKLVVGVEMTPYPQLFRFLDQISINLGGMVGNLGTQAERTVFRTCDSVGVAPIICYESVFGEFCTEYIHKGAQILAVITNDGWWGDTPGYRNHFNYSKLRAIELRRWLVRSANTGISGVITPAGATLERLGWWQQGAIRCRVAPESRVTFYAQWGDYLGRMAYLSIVILILGGVVMCLKNKNSRKS